MIEDILEEVRKERIAQDSRFGWPRIHEPSWWLAILSEEFGEFARDVVEREFEEGRYTDNMRNELIQVAAVAIAAIEDLDHQYDEWEKEKW